MIVATDGFRRHHHASDYIIEILDISEKFALAQIQPVAETAEPCRRRITKEKTREKYHLPVSVKHRLLEPIQVIFRLWGWVREKMTMLAGGRARGW